MSYIHTKLKESELTIFNTNFEQGTWLSLPANIISDAEYMNLHEEENYARIFHIDSPGMDSLNFSFVKQTEKIDCLKLWFVEIKQECLYEPLRDKVGVKSILDLEDLKIEKLTEHEIEVPQGFAESLALF